MVRRIGLGMGMGFRRGPSGGGLGATAPGAFTAGQWGVLPAGTGEATFNILTLPSNGGSAITALQYRLTSGGSWIAFAAATTGSYTVGGFTDGVATDVFVRAVNAIGAGNASDTKSVTTSAGTAPSAFTVEQWGVINFGSGTARIGVQFLPSAGTSPITRLDYRVAGGSWLTLTNTPAIAEYTITGLVDGAYRNIEIAAVSAVGRASPSDVKKVWTGVGVMPQVAYYGSKTLAGGGCFRPLDHTGTAVDLTTSPAPSPATSGAYTANITTTGPGTGLTFSGGGAGAPNGATFTVALAAGGTVAIEIATIANMFHVASLPQASTAFGSATVLIGDQIRIRAGDHNMALGAAQNINASRNTPGTWNNPADIRNGNWLVITRDPAHTTRVGALQVGQGGNAFQRYVRVHDLDFLSPMNANNLGGGGNASAQLDMVGGFISNAFYAVTNCRFAHTATVTGLTVASSANGDIGPRTAILVSGGPYWIEGNTVNGCFVGINAGTFNAPQTSYIRRNTIRRAQIDGVLLGTSNNLVAEGNLLVDKVWPHHQRTPSAVTPGATTTFTVSNTTDLTSQSLVILRGFTGDFAQFNGRCENPTSFTGTTITLPINSTGLVNGLTGFVTFSAPNHGDYWQFTEASGQQQNNVTLRGNMLLRGICDGHEYPDGQGFFGGTTSGQPIRTGWKIEGNIIEASLLRGISIWGLTNSIIRNNTVVRVLGLDGSTSNSQVAQIIMEGASGVVYRDNLANAFNYGGSAAEDTNNVPVTLASPTSAIPATAGNIAVYNSHFDAPPTVPDSTYVGQVAYATKTVGGAQGSPPIFAGATTAYNFATLTYSNPRAATVPFAVLDGQWSISDAITTGDAILTILDLPLDGDSPLTGFEYSIAGGAWTTLSGGATTGARSIPGFTDGLATNVQVRAVNAVGPSAASPNKSVTTSAPAAPSAFTVGQWSVADTVSSGDATFTIGTLPSANGSAITALQYSINGGGWIGFSGNTVGDYTVAGFTDGVATNVQVRAVNAIGNGAASDTKSVTTSAPTGIVHVANSTVVEQASGTTLTVPLATNIAGDLLVLAIVYDQTNNPTTPAGWTLSHTIVGFTANVPELKVYTKISNGSEGANIAVTVPNRSHIGATASFRIPNATPIGNVSTANVFSATSRTSQSITAMANSIILHGYTWYPGGALANVSAAPSGVTQMFSVRSTIKGGGLWLGWEKRIGGGATPARTLTLDASNGMTGGQIELRSA